jgi:serine/threonine protein phosphatase PrpC
MRISDGDVFSSSVRGNVRKQNEDSCGVFDVPNGKLYVVCDGMGGHAGGATASKLGVDSIANYFQQAKYPDVKLALANALEYANLQIIDAANEMPSLKGMGTTACVLLIQGDEAWIAHCGDSRIYLYSAEQQWLHRITKDHSYVQGLVDQGLITDAEAETHPNKNRILKALGIKAGCKPTVCEQPILPANGDTFLICSDGLSGMVNDEQLQYVLQQEGTILNKGQMMIQLALQAGGLDNITTQLIKISDSPHAHSVFVSQNPKERLTPKIPPTPLPTGGKKSPKLMLKIMIPVVIVLLIACGSMWILSSPPSKSNDKQIVSPSSYNANAHEEKGDMSPANTSNAKTNEGNSQSCNEEGNYVLEYWEVFPQTSTHKKVKSNFEADIKVDKHCTDPKKNYKYKQVIKGHISEGEKHNVKVLYRKTVGDNEPVIMLIEPTKTETPSKNRVKVEKYNCNIEGHQTGKPQTLEDVQWQFTYTEGSKSSELSGYYKSKDEVIAAANIRMSSAPDSVLCIAEWFNYAKDIKGVLDNKTKNDTYIKKKQEKEKKPIQAGNQTDNKEGSITETISESTSVSASDSAAPEKTSSQKKHSKPTKPKK